MSNCQDCEIFKLAINDKELLEFKIDIETLKRVDLIKMRHEGCKLIFPILEAYEQNVMVGRRLGISSPDPGTERTAILNWIVEMSDREVIS